MGYAPSGSACEAGRRPRAVFATVWSLATEEQDGLVCMCRKTGYMRRKMGYMRCKTRERLQKGSFDVSLTQIGYSGQRYGTYEVRNGVFGSVQSQEQCRRQVQKSGSLSGGGALTRNTQGDGKCDSRGNNKNLRRGYIGNKLRGIRGGRGSGKSPKKGCKGLAVTNIVIRWLRS